MVDILLIFTKNECVFVAVFPLKQKWEHGIIFQSTGVNPAKTYFQIV